MTREALCESDILSAIPDNASSSWPATDLTTVQSHDLNLLDISDEFSGAMEEPSACTGDLMGDSFWPFSTSWQWTHEDLYFQGIPAVDLMEAELEAALPQPTSDNCINGEIRQQEDFRQMMPESSNDISLNFRRTSQVDSIRSRAGSRERRSPSVLALKDIVDGFVNLAISSDHGQTFNRTPKWHGLALRLSRFLVVGGNKDGSDRSNDDRNVLDYLIDQYFDHFHPLWPLVCSGRHSRAEWHPILYLTLTSIGALYSGTATAASYGSLMHTAIRNTLIHLPIRNDQKEAEALDIGRAMLLTQVAALYFEQEGAFSAALQLGATLNAHAHRMRLFTLKRARSHGEFPRMSGRECTIAQGRAMLAYGMLRAETFTSVLLNRKPLLSYEEINLPLPFSGLATDLSSDNGTREQERALPCGGVLFSDLVRIALDENEILPPLRPVDLELLLFGLQHDVWRFSHDPDIFTRLVGKRHSHDLEFDQPTSRSPSQSQDRDLLDHTTRQMRYLLIDHKRIDLALEKWQVALSRTQLSYPAASNRSTYLSGLILYKLSFLRLFAPVEGIQQIAYQLYDPATSDEAVLAQVTTWTFTTEARKAVEHAHSIWRLLNAETSVTRADQTRYNILSLIALHHAAAVVWAVVGTEGQASLCFESSKHGVMGGSDGIKLRRENTRALMLLFADLYPKITSAWGMQSSFSTMVKKLADHPFPKIAASQAPRNHESTGADFRDMDIG